MINATASSEAVSVSMMKVRATRVSISDPFAVTPPSAATHLLEASRTEPLFRRSERSPALPASRVSQTSPPLKAVTCGSMKRRVESKISITLFHEAVTVLSRRNNVHTTNAGRCAGHDDHKRDLLGILGQYLQGRKKLSL